MGWTVITSASAASTTTPTTSGVNTTGADLIVAAMSWYQGNDPTGAHVITDSKGNTWTGLTKIQSSTRHWLRLFYTRPTSVGSGHTFSTDSTDLNGSLGAIAFSGSKASPFDVENGFTDTVTGHTTIQPGSITPTQNSELIVTAMGVEDPGSNTFSIDSGFTKQETQDGVPGSWFGLVMGYLAQGTAAAVNPTWTRSNATTNGVGDSAVIASFFSTGRFFLLVRR